MGSDFKLFGRSIPFGGDCDLPLSHSEKCGDGSVDPGRSGKKDAGAMEKASMSVKCSEILAMPEGGGMAVAKEWGGGVEEASNMVEEKDKERNCIINNGEENVMKRPEMLLPCPRCESLDTKFCYFNNCNANQPRHFCRSCQRYWTAGGTLRNVPMGSGRRKSKNSSASHPHNHPRNFLNLDNGGLSVQSDVVASAQQLPPAGGVVLTTTTTSRHLKMGPSLPASEIPEFEQNAAGQVGPCATHGFSNGSCKIYALNERQSPLNSDELACGSSVGAHAQACETTEAPKQQPAPFSPPMGPWPYSYGLLSWNNGSNSEVDKSLATPSEAWCGNPWMGGVLPWPLMPFPSWAPPGSWGGRPWNMPLMPLLPPWGFPMLPTTANGNSPSLGKHPREGAPNGCLLTPKVLRIHDPKEAAQSSIWSALGLDNNNNRFDLPPCGIFKRFPPKANTEPENEELSAQALYANPAAMTRSVAFHENI